MSEVSREEFELLKSGVFKLGEHVDFLGEGLNSLISTVRESIVDEMGKQKIIVDELTSTTSSLQKRVEEAILTWARGRAVDYEG